jgi:7-carboxy-7-deazaguanine synthase
VTGGEPLAQKNCQILLKKLCDAGYEVSLETSGALDVCGVDERVVKVMDIKTPGSGESAKNIWGTINCLNRQDQVKFVVCDRADYDWAKQVLDDYKLVELCEVLFSPVYGQQQARDLAEWILKDRLAVRFQIQLHKILWGDEQGR